MIAMIPAATIMHERRGTHPRVHLVAEGGFILTPSIPKMQWWGQQAHYKQGWWKHLLTNMIISYIIYVIIYILCTTYYIVWAPMGPYGALYGTLWGPWGPIAWLICEGLLRGGSGKVTNEKQAAHWARDPGPGPKKSAGPGPLALFFGLGPTSRAQCAACFSFVPLPATPYSNPSQISHAMGPHGPHRVP